MSNPFKALTELYQEQVEKQDQKGHADLFKKATDACINWIRQSGYTVENIEYLNGYYIFGYGTNSVIHYHIKECPHWKFAIWWGAEEKENSEALVNGTFFCEYEQNIDKFKPTCSEYVDNLHFRECEFDSKKVNWGLEFHLIKTIEYISKHPLRAFYRTYCGTDFNKEYIPYFKIVYEFCYFKTYKWIAKTLNNYFERVETKFIRKNILSICNYDAEYQAELVNLGEGWSPKYEIQCRIPDDADEEDTGCFSVFEDDCILKRKWDKLIKRHDKIADIFHIWHDNVCHDSIAYYRIKDFEGDSND